MISWTSLVNKHNKYMLPLQKTEPNAFHNHPHHLLREKGLNSLQLPWTGNISALNWQYNDHKTLESSSCILPPPVLYHRPPPTVLYHRSINHHIMLFTNLRIINSKKRTILNIKLIRYKYKSKGPIPVPCQRLTLWQQNKRPTAKCNAHRLLLFTFCSKSSLRNFLKFH